MFVDASMIHPSPIEHAAEPSCARTIVNVSVEIPVTRTTSRNPGIDEGGIQPGMATALNGVAGKSAPSPALTVNVVPLVAGDGAVTTALTAKLPWASATESPGSAGERATQRPARAPRSTTACSRWRDHRGSRRTLEDNVRPRHGPEILGRDEPAQELEITRPPRAARSPLSRRSGRHPFSAARGFPFRSCRTGARPSVST